MEGKFQRYSCLLLFMKIDSDSKHTRIYENNVGLVGACYETNCAMSCYMSLKDCSIHIPVADVLVKIKSKTMYGRGILEGIHNIYPF